MAGGLHTEIGRVNQEWSGTTRPSSLLAGRRSPSTSVLSALVLRNSGALSAKEPSFSGPKIQTCVLTHFPRATSAVWYISRAAKMYSPGSCHSEFCLFLHRAHIGRTLGTAA